jgi:hypothetical protein
VLELVEKYLTTGFTPDFCTKKPRKQKGGGNLSLCRVKNCLAA